MHEMSIAVELLELVLAAAEPHGPLRVRGVSVRIGAMRLVVPEALQFAWRQICAGTQADGAELELSEVPLRVRCRQCAAEYQPEIDDFLCPRCRQADVDILEGNDIILESLELVS